MTGVKREVGCWHVDKSGNHEVVYKKSQIIGVAHC